MSRCEYADVLTWYGEVSPVPTDVWDEAAVTKQITLADKRLDAFTNPAKLPTTGDTAEAIACETVFRMIRLINLTQSNDPAANWYKVFNEDLVLAIENGLKEGSTTKEQISRTGDMIAE